MNNLSAKSGFQTQWKKKKKKKKRKPYSGSQKALLQGAYVLFYTKPYSNAYRPLLKVVTYSHTFCLLLQVQLVCFNRCPIAALCACRYMLTPIAAHLARHYKSIDPNSNLIWRQFYARRNKPKPPLKGAYTAALFVTTAIDLLRLYNTNGMNCHNRTHS